MEKQKLTLGHSPDPDDAFMFYAMARDLIPMEGFQFEHILQDIQTLNDRAHRGELDVSAISIHAYTQVCDQYALLPSGASMGDGYGPILVAKRQISPEVVGNHRIAIPGSMTSAFLALQLFTGKSAKELNYVIVPFDLIFEAVENGVAEVGLLIHEGQLTYEKRGMQLIADLGAWWKETNDGLPLPLGGNVIHKRISPEDRKTVSDIISASIRYSLDHREEAVKHSMKYGRGLDQELADKFVGMYVNDWTVDYGERGREAIRRFLGQAAERGFIERAPELEFVS